MLSLEVHGELVALIGAVNRLIAAAGQRAPFAEIELRVMAARTSAERLERMTDTTFPKLERHLDWLEKRHREGSPELADGDIDDLRDQDLPHVVETVTAWTTRLLDRGLVDAITASWTAHDYDGAVRDAFIELETRMKTLATTGPGETLFGRRLVNRLFDPPQLPAAISEHGFMGHLTDGEIAGARDLIAGSIGLFRNATAHRAVPYTRDEATDVIHLVNVCLRILDKMRNE